MSSQDELLQQARDVREHAYAPYSGFRVGAAVGSRDGRVFAGCNVENASYGLCSCAERAALCAAVAGGCRPGDLTRMAIVADSDGPVSPCGGCRQLMLELGGDTLAVTLANMRGDTRETSAGELLPGAFHLHVDTASVLPQP